MKDELGGEIMTEFATLRPKMYAFKTSSLSQNLHFTISLGYRSQGKKVPQNGKERSTTNKRKEGSLCLCAP